MNQSKILTIEVLISIEWFTVQFETDSIERNRLMTVRYNGFLLDTAELPHTHPTYYKEMKKEMCKAAEAHWNSTNEESVSQQITGIPTLDYQTKASMATRAIDALVKPLLIALIFVLPHFVYSQDTIYCRKVKIADNVGISMKTGKVLYAHPRWRKVESGFFVKQPNGLYLINGKERHPGNKKPLKIKR